MLHMPFRAAANAFNSSEADWSYERPIDAPTGSFPHMLDEPDNAPDNVDNDSPTSLPIEITDNPAPSSASGSAASGATAHQDHIFWFVAITPV